MDMIDMLNTEKASPNKKMNKKMKKNVEDSMSELPDEVIVHVLSFLPLKTAAATSVLSRRWIGLWKQVPNLKIDDLGPYNQLSHLFLGPQLDYSISRQEYEWSQHCMRKYIDWVNSVVESYNKSHSLPLKEFSIVVLVDKPNQHQFTKWLEFAFSRRIETLKLISNEYWYNAGVLADMLKGMSIPMSSDYFKSLKVLWLESFNMSSEAIEFLLQCCPMLETLVLDKLRVTTDLEIVSSSIKHLDMRCNRICAKSLKIRAPNLTWLTIDHDMKTVSFENVPKLVNMTVYFGLYMDTMHDVAQVAAQLETLIIFLTLPKVMFSVPEMPNLKKLVVYYRLQWPNVLLPVTCFMQAAPALEDFRIDVGELDVDRKVFRISKGHEHLHLRRFVLSGFCGGCWDRIELVRYMVNYCTALEEIVIGQCNREGLVRDFVDHCVPLHHLIPPKPIHINYVATTSQERQQINNIVRLFTPSTIKLQVV